MADGNSPATEKKEELIGDFSGITYTSREEAELCLEHHRWDLNAAINSFFGSNVPNPKAEQLLPSSPNLGIDEPVRSHSPSDDSTGFFSAAPSRTPRRLRFRSRSPSPPNAARYTRLPNREADDPSENNGGGDQSGAMVQHHPEDAHVETPPESTVRLVRDIDSAQPRLLVLTIWRNGFSMNGGPLNSLNDDAYALLFQSIQIPQSPSEVNQPDSNIEVKVIKRPYEDFPEPPATSVSLVLDPAAPTTEIHIRLADGTPITSVFNTHHTVGDIRSFIDNSRPGGSTNYELLSMGFPHSPLPDPEQTIEDAGIAKSVLIQKLR